MNTWICLRNCVIWTKIVCIFLHPCVFGLMSRLFSGDACLFKYLLFVSSRYALAGKHQSLGFKARRQTRRQYLFFIFFQHSDEPTKTPCTTWNRRRNIDQIKKCRQFLFFFFANCLQLLFFHSLTVFRS